jgi:hypothetical protein
MITIRDIPFGLEDGRILNYCARDGRLQLEYEFWNEKRGTLVFEGYVGACDRGALGAEVGSFTELGDSALIESLLNRNYKIRPESHGWKHFRFLGVDDDVLFEVVAPSCSFTANNSSSGL